MLNSGLRVGEMLALTWNDVNFDEKCFSVNKSLKRTSKVFDDGNDYKTSLKCETPKTQNSFRSIPLSEELKKILLKQKEHKDILKSINNDYYKDTGVIFSSENGTPIDPRNFTRHLYSVCKKAGIDKINSHIFRHTFITNAVKNNVDPSMLKRIVGHSNISVTDSIYTHIDVNDLRESMDKIKHK